MKDFLTNNPWVLRLLYSLIAVAAGVFLYWLFSHLLVKRLEKSNRKFFKGKKSDTYIKLFRSLNRYLFFIIVFLAVLRINGVDIGAMVTGVGVVGIILGFAIQDALKDIIKGVDIMADSYFHVGDVIRTGEYTGRVIAIGIKTTRLQDVYEGNVVSISNRNIEKVEVLSHLILIDVPLPYEMNSADAARLLTHVVEELKKLDKVEKAAYRGVTDFAPSSINYRVEVYCPPVDKVPVRRDALTCILACLEAADVHIPYQQIDVHQKL